MVPPSEGTMGLRPFRTFMLRVPWLLNGSVTGATQFELSAEHKLLRGGGSGIAGRGSAVFNKAQPSADAWGDTREAPAAYPSGWERPSSSKRRDRGYRHLTQMTASRSTAKISN
eukprot:6462197-Amphidinium_carterae.1